LQKGYYYDITDRYEFFNFARIGFLGEVASRIEADVKILTFASKRHKVDPIQFFNSLKKSMSNMNAKRVMMKITAANT
jgi:hypothetical protein